MKNLSFRSHMVGGLRGVDRFSNSHFSLGQTPAEVYGRFADNPMDVVIAAETGRPGRWSLQTDLYRMHEVATTEFNRCVQKYSCEYRRN